MEPARACVRLGQNLFASSRMAGPSVSMKNAAMASSICACASASKMIRKMARLPVFRDSRVEVLPLRAAMAAPWAVAAGRCLAPGVFRLALHR